MPELHRFALDIQCDSHITYFNNTCLEKFVQMLLSFSSTQTSINTLVFTQVANTQFQMIYSLNIMGIVGVEGIQLANMLPATGAQLQQSRSWSWWHLLTQLTCFCCYLNSTGFGPCKSLLITENLHQSAYIFLYYIISSMSVHALIQLLALF